MKRIKVIRESRGLSQDDVAKAINVSQSCVAKWESGGVYPRHSCCRRLPESLIAPSTSCSRARRTSEADISAAWNKPDSHTKHRISRFPLARRTGGNYVKTYHFDCVGCGCNRTYGCIGRTEEYRRADSCHGCRSSNVPDCGDWTTCLCHRPRRTYRRARASWKRV